MAPYYIDTFSHELNPLKYTGDRLPGNLKFNVKVKYSPDVDNLLDLLNKIRVAYGGWNNQHLLLDDLSYAIEATLNHNPDDLDFLFSKELEEYDNIIYSVPYNEYFGARRGEETCDNNLYGNLLADIRVRLKYYRENTLEDIVNNILLTLNRDENVKTAIIGGSWALKKAERAFNKDKPWVPDDVDIYITMNSKIGLYNLHEDYFQDYRYTVFNNSVMTLEMPIYGTKIQLVHIPKILDVDNKDFYREGYVINQLVAAIDISVTQCFLTVKNPKEKLLNPRVKNVYNVLDYNETMNLIVTETAKQDILGTQLHFYADETYDDPKVYEFRVKRLEKYKKRGFTDVTYTPKHLTEPIFRLYTEIEHLI
jgi:hypothetical protein